MDWAVVISGVSVTATAILGFLTLRRGNKADEALNVATNVQTTFDAQKSIVDNLQEEVERYRGDLNEHRSMLLKCEEDCRSCRSNLAGAQMIIKTQELEIQNLKNVVSEHENTIAKHERTLSQVSRREDMKPKREGDEERRKTCD